MLQLKRNKARNGIVLTFGVIYCLISLVNHYNFSTSALDLGTYNNAIYDYAHFRFNDSMILQPQLNNLLSDHFELLIILISPFYYLFGTYTLLIFQVLFILAAGIAIYKLSNEIFLKNESMSLIAMVHFYSFIGIFTALSFDFHNNVIGAMIVPWFMYFFFKEKYIPAAIIFMLQLISKENIALWSIFICIGLMMLSVKSKTRFYFAGILSLVALIYFFMVIKVIIPSIANEGRDFMHISVSYTAAGNSFSEIVYNLLSNPELLLKLLFTNHTGGSNGDYYKTEMYLIFLASGGALLFLRPQFLFMLIPVFAQKMFHNDYLKWGISFHYAIEFIPVLTIGLIYIASTFDKLKIRFALLISFLALSLMITIRTFDSSIALVDKSKIGFYKKRHYEKKYDVKEVHKVLNEINADIKVSAISSFVPHLALRNYIYTFPVIQDAEYIVVSAKENTYPLSKEDFNSEIARLKQSSDWEAVIENEDILVLKKK